MSKVTYKGIELGKTAKEYSQVQVAELVALHMKHNCDSEGVYEGTIASTLEKMFGFEWDVWEKKVSSISTLIKYLGYRPSRDGNGRAIWRVPDEELKSGGIRVTKDVPAPTPRKKKESIVETKVQDAKETTVLDEHQKKVIPENLLKNIRERTNTMFTCEFCGKEYKVIAKGPHMRWHYGGGLSANGIKLIEAIETFPGMGVQAYEDVLGWPRTQVRSTMSMLKKRHLVESSGASVSTKYFSLRTDKDKLEQEKVTDGPIMKDKNGKVGKPVRIRNMQPDIDNGIESLKVIKAVDGSIYHIKGGKLYKVYLEEVPE